MANINFSQNPNLTAGYTPAAVSGNIPFNTRILADANYSVTIAGPASATTANSNNINLQTVAPYAVTETINVQLSTTASANGNNVNGNIYLQHTSANSDGTANSAAWVNIPTLGATSVPQTTTTAAVTATYKLPPGCLQFIRGVYSAPSNTGNVADSNLTVQLLF